MSQYYYRLKIGTKYLTENGLTAGRPCFLTVSGVDALRKTVVKVPVTCADGSIDVREFDANGNKTLDVEIETLPNDTGEYLLTAYNDSTVLNVIGTEGETGDFNVNAEILDLNFRDFRKGFWKKVTLKLVTVI